MPEQTSELSVACVLVTHLPVEAERRRYPALLGRPLVIVERHASGELVLDCSAEAAGVAAGMPLAEALARCPYSVVMQADVSYYSDTFDRLADSLAMRCSAVEKGQLGCLYATIEGLSQVYGGEARLAAALLQAVPPGFRPRLGVSSGKLAAYAAAVTAPDGRAVKASSEAVAFLSDCSIGSGPMEKMEPIPASSRLSSAVNLGSGDRALPSRALPSRALPSKEGRIRQTPLLPARSFAGKTIALI